CSTPTKRSSPVRSTSSRQRWTTPTPFRCRRRSRWRNGSAGWTRLASCRGSSAILA
ncbi:MAG: hypothetical protein AVDCRST_MAG31-2706, partial [uncultured Sphingomonas sp.]